jgi:hypothetical protein
VKFFRRKSEEMPRRWRDKPSHQQAVRGKKEGFWKCREEKMHAHLQEAYI